MVSSGSSVRSSSAARSPSESPCSLSPLSPIGPVRPVVPVPRLRVRLDGPRIGLRRVGDRARRDLRRRSRTATRAASPPGGSASATRAHRTRRRAVAEANLPVPAATGIRFALEPGHGRTTVPIRSTILGTALALIVVVAHADVRRELAAHSCRTLRSTDGTGTTSSRAAAASATCRRHSPPRPSTPTATSARGRASYFGTAAHRRPQRARARGTRRTRPSILRSSRGTGSTAANQIVLGANTLTQLHRHIGETVEREPRRREARCRCGSSGPPACPPWAVAHRAATTWSWAPARCSTRDWCRRTCATPAGTRRPAPTPRSFASVPGSTAPRRGTVLPTLRAGSAFRRTGGSRWSPCNAPPKSSTTDPSATRRYILGGTLAAGALFALALTLVASVRRRRHDLALLKTFGFTRVQLAAVVAWQATVSVLIGIAVGVPLGIIIGRQLWNVFAREIHVVPNPSIPTATIALVAVGAIVARQRRRGRARHSSRTYAHRRTPPGRVNSSPTSHSKCAVPCPPRPPSVHVLAALLSGLWFSGCRRS